MADKNDNTKKTASYTQRRNLQSFYIRGEFLPIYFEWLKCVDKDKKRFDKLRYRAKLNTRSLAICEAIYKDYQENYENKNTNVSNNSEDNLQKREKPNKINNTENNQIEEEKEDE